jgi:hypothetical protein
MSLGKKITEIVDKVVNVSVPLGTRILSNSRHILKRNKQHNKTQKKNEL